MATGIERLGVVHYVASCGAPECCFHGSGLTEKEKAALRRAAIRHVEKTGHSVTIENGAITIYSKKRIVKDG